MAKGLHREGYVNKRESRRNGNLSDTELEMQEFARAGRQEETPEPPAPTAIEHQPTEEVEEAPAVANDLLDDTPSIIDLQETKPGIFDGPSFTPQEERRRLKRLVHDVLAQNPAELEAAPTEESAKALEDAAITHRNEAAAVADDFEGNVFYDQKRAQDPFELLREKIAADPDISDALKDTLHFKYRAVVPKKDPDGPGAVDVRTFSTYHDVLRARAALPREYANEREIVRRDKNNQIVESTEQIMVDSRGFFNEIGNPNSPLSKYKDEALQLLKDVKSEQLPDGYAQAAARGEVVLPEKVAETTRAIPLDASVAPAVIPDVAPVEEQAALDAAPEAVETASAVVPEPIVLDDAIESPETAGLPTFIRPQRSPNRFVSPKERPAERNGIEAEYLIERSSALDKTTKRLGLWVETFTRNRGEAYNKLNWKYKLAIGTGLGVGAATLAGVAPFIATGASVGLGIQRAYGLASMYVKIEKHLQNTSEGNATGYFASREWYKKIANKPESQRKLAAAMIATGYTVGMSAAIVGAVYMGREAAHAISETDMSGVMHDAQATLHDWNSTVHTWLHEHWPFDNAVISSTSPAAVSNTEAIPTLSVEATPGHGYEYMVKQLWKQLHDRNISLPQSADYNSDLAQLLDADEKTIDAVVHRIASDPTHGFFHADGSSVTIDPQAHISIDAEGQLHFSTDASHVGAVHAPEHAATTPKYESTPARTDVAPTAVQMETVPDAVTPLTEPPPPVQPPEAPWMHPGAHTAPAEAATAPETAPVDAVTPPTDDATNQFPFTSGKNFLIPKFEPHIYADGGDKHLFVYGSTQAEQARVAEEFLKTQKPGTVVFGGDGNMISRIAYKLGPGGELARPEPVRNDGFLGFFRSIMEAPKPEDFHDGKIIK